MPASECQWFGVAMETTSTFLSSNTLRMSVACVTGLPALPNLSTSLRMTVLSTSHRLVMRTPDILPNSLRCDWPRPPKPTTEMRTSLFEPATCDHERAVQLTAAVARAVRVRKPRRLSAFIN